jgi:hypothetical protein
VQFAANGASHPPSNQCSLSTRRVILDAVDGLAGQASFLGDLSDTHGLLAQRGEHRDELFACEARLTAKVSARSSLTLA